VKLEIIRDEPGYLALEPFWDKLLAKSHTHSPFQAWDYVWLWWQECRDSFQLCIGVVRDHEGQVMGIAPLVIGPGSDKNRRHLKHLGFMNGKGPLQGERLDFIVPEGRESEVTSVLVTVVTESRHLWDVVRLNKIPTESMNYAHIMTELRWAGRSMGVLNMTECRWTKLPATWNEYSMLHSGNWRRKMRKRWEQLSEGHMVRKVLAGKDVPIELAIDRFFELHSMIYPEGVSSFLREQCQRLHRKLMSTWLLDGRATLCMIELDGKLIAGIYCLRSKTETLQYQLGRDPEYAKLGLGNLSMQWGLECAMESGSTVYDLLPGDYPYKREWCDRVRFVSDIECFNPLSLRAYTFRILRSFKRLISRPKLSQKAPLSEEPDPA
jgi:CelD/BcsL family acetyltransferase involved in cellulose biosynthesis